MGLFDFFKSNKNLGIEAIGDLKIGSSLEFEYQEYKVKDVLEYDWGNDDFSVEYLISNGQKELYLHVEENEELKLDLSSEIAIHELGANFKNEIITNDAPPKIINYKGEEFNLMGEFLGHCKSQVEAEGWEEFVSWDFYNYDGSRFISVTRWDEEEIEAVIGKYEKSFKFTNLKK